MAALRTQLDGQDTHVLLQHLVTVPPLERASLSDETPKQPMSEEELREIETRLEQGECRLDDMRGLIHAVRALNSQLDSIQRALSELASKS